MRAVPTVRSRPVLPIANQNFHRLPLGACFTTGARPDCDCCVERGVGAPPWAYYCAPMGGNRTPLDFMHLPSARSCTFDSCKTGDLNALHRSPNRRQHTALPPWRRPTGVRPPSYLFYFAVVCIVSRGPVVFLHLCVFCYSREKVGMNLMAENENEKKKIYKLTVKADGPSLWGRFSARIAQTRPSLDYIPPQAPQLLRRGPSARCLPLQCPPVRGPVPPGSWALLFPNTFQNGRRIVRLLLRDSLRTRRRPGPPRRCSLPGDCSAWLACITFWL